MAGSLLGHLTGLPVALASLLAGALALALIWRGGLRSDAAANRLQFVVMFAGFALIIPFAWHGVGSPAAIAAKLPAGHMSWTGGLGPAKLIGWWLIAVWTIVDPSFHLLVDLLTGVMKVCKHIVRVVVLVDVVGVGLLTNSLGD